MALEDTISRLFAFDPTASISTGSVAGDRLVQSALRQQQQTLEMAETGADASLQAEKNAIARRTQMFNEMVAQSNQAEQKRRADEKNRILEGQTLFNELAFPPIGGGGGSIGGGTAASPPIGGTSPTPDRIAVDVGGSSPSRFERQALPQKDKGNLTINSNISPLWGDITGQFGDQVEFLGVWGDESHQKRSSPHNTGDSIDIGIRGNLELGRTIADKVVSEAKERNVRWVIHNGRKWEASTGKWRDYKGKNPHRGHVDVSFYRNKNNAPPRPSSQSGSFNKEDLLPHLGPGLKPYAQDFIDAGMESGIDPRFLASISKLETANGTSSAFRNKRNAMGISDSKGPISMPSVRESIFRQAGKMSRENGPYQGANTISEIGKIYAPPGAGNDPRGTNSSWPAGVTKFFNQMGGDPSSTIRGNFREPTATVPPEGLPTEPSQPDAGLFPGGGPPTATATPVLNATPLPQQPSSGARRGVPPEGLQARPIDDQSQPATPQQVNPYQSNIDEAQTSYRDAVQRKTQASTERARITSQVAALEGRRDAIGRSARLGKRPNPVELREINQDIARLTSRFNELEPQLEQAKRDEAQLQKAMEDANDSARLWQDQQNTFQGAVEGATSTADIADAYEQADQAGRRRIRLRLGDGIPDALGREFKRIEESEKVETVEEPKPTVAEEKAFRAAVIAGAAADINDRATIDTFLDRFPNHPAAEQYRKQLSRVPLTVPKREEIFRNPGAGASVGIGTGGTPQDAAPRLPNVDEITVPVGLGPTTAELAKFLEDGLESPFGTAFMVKYPNHPETVRAKREVGVLEDSPSPTRRTPVPQSPNSISLDNEVDSLFK